jgi:hypothetical protein
VTRALASVAVGLGALALVACSSETGSPATRFGTVLLESNSGVEPAQGATGYFYRYASTPVSGKCFLSEELGACRVWKCDDYSTEDKIETVPVTAGPVSVTGTKLGVVLVEGDTGSYAPEAALETPLWVGGERVRVAVAGSDDFPAASLGVIAPEPITLTAPDVSEEPLQFDASKDLAFAWTAIENSNVFAVVSIAMPNPDGEGNVLFPGLDCAYFGTSGAGLMPASVLAKLPKPDGIAGYQVEALTFASNAIRVDDAVLTLQATSFALSTLATVE